MKYPALRTLMGALLTLSLFLGPISPASAASKSVSFETSGWIPYWRTAAGVADATSHLSSLTEVNPFGFTVRSDGTLYDAAGMSQAPWTGLVTAAGKSNTRIVPTVMWSDGTQIDHVLSDSKLRSAHIKAIVSMVKNGGYAGVDIDYEGKLVSTKDSYSRFLKDLKSALGSSKLLECTIEPRTPYDSLNTLASESEIQYSNDYAAIGSSCDRVRVMAYDQQTVDKVLNAQNAGTIYAPVADIAWVKKVLQLTLQDIPAAKLELGVASYGYEYDVTALPNGTYTYKRLWAFNPRYATDIASSLSLTPARNAAGEMSVSYLSTTTPSLIPKSVAAPRGTLSANVAAARATSYAKSSGVAQTFRLLSWSDAGAVASKVALAHTLKLRGVALFKIDGGEDADLWNSFR